MMLKKNYRLKDDNFSPKKKTHQMNIYKLNLITKLFTNISKHIIKN